MSVIDGKPLRGYSRGKTPVTQVVLHESATYTRDDAIGVLLARHLSVHFSVERDGAVQQHLDTKLAGAHAEGFGKPSLHNESSVAVEVSGIYYGHRLDEAKRREPLLYGDAFAIETCWADRAWNKQRQDFNNPRRLYVPPTPAQLEATWGLLNAIWDSHPLIDRAFPAVEGGIFVWDTWAGHEGARGVVAHCRWAHRDGLFPEHYLLARMLGHEPAEAYELTLDRASAGTKHTVLAGPS